MTTAALASLYAVARELTRLDERLRALEERMKSRIDRVPPDRRESARNLVHYVALRQHDLRYVQEQLSLRGLSSLGRSEAWARGSVLETALRAHESLALRGDERAARELRALEAARAEALSWDTAKDLLHQHTRDVLGPRPEDRHIYIMVTAPSAKEADRAWMLSMLAAGMNVLRINCAHETPREWRRTVEALDEARRASGAECRVLMDLAGPKIRTGPISGERHILGWKPTKDELGAVVAPARVSLRRASAKLAPDEGPALMLSDALFSKVEPEDELRVARQEALAAREGRERGRDPGARERPRVLARARARGPVSPGKADRRGQDDRGGRLRRGHRRQGRRRAGAHAARGPRHPARARQTGQGDRRALRFVVKHADAVSLSFVRTPDDIRTLHRELDRLGRESIGVVLKIETRTGFENLPRLLMEGLRRPPLAVMIARGDLGVEVGFERLAELQEEILWLCEASHVPAIWATQVLDTLARTGVPSRAEVTDAAASVAAECVMLNKGPFIVEAVRVLADILRRMEKHRYKKRSLFRKLRVSTFTE